MATKNTQKIGWIGMGRMGFPMAERLLKAGHDVSIWNRTRAKAEPLRQDRRQGGRSAARADDVDVLFSIVSTGKDVEDVLFGKDGVAAGGKMPPIWSTARPSRSRNPPRSATRLKELGSDFVASPVSGNAKVIKAGKLSAVVSGPEAACKTVDAADRGLRAARRVLCRATASSRASARSPTMSCSASSSRT